MCSRPPAPVVPSQLAPNLAPLAPLLGTWQGKGSGKYPTIEPFSYVEETTFSHVGRPFIEMKQRTWHPEAKTPMHTETGYLRVVADGAVELVLCDPTGLVEVYQGAVRTSEDGGLELSLQSTSITATPSAKPVTNVTRTLVLRGQQLQCSLDMEAVGQPMQEHLRATLERAPSNEVTVEEARTKLDQYEAIVDVREASQVAATPGLPKAVNVPLGLLLSSAPSVGLPGYEGGLVLVHCGSGARSLIAVNSWLAKGVKAVSLAGGLKAWNA